MWFAYCVADEWQSWMFLDTEWCHIFGLLCFMYRGLSVLHVHKVPVALVCVLMFLPGYAIFEEGMLRKLSNS